LHCGIPHETFGQRGTVKVDAARKRGGIKIVWLSWFTDSVALWRRLEETPYFLDDPHAVNPSSSPTSDPHQISSDPEPDEDDWDREPVGTQESSFELGALDWSQINAEVDEFLNETDDDEDARSEASVMRDGNVSEDEARDETVSTSRSVDSVFSSLASCFSWCRNLVAAPSTTLQSWVGNDYAAPHLLMEVGERMICLDLPLRNAKSWQRSGRGTPG